MIKFFNNLKLIYVTFLLFAAAFFNNLNAQNTNSDFALWNSIGVDYSFNNKLKIGIEYNLRLKEKSSVIDEVFSEIYLEYEIFKNFEITGGARFIKEKDNQGKKQGNEHHFRYNFDASYKHSIKSLEISYRFRYQNKNELGILKEDGDIPGQNVRFKTSFEYSIKKWPLDPELSVELFSKIESQTKMQLNKYRLTFGTDYKTKDLGKIGIYYRFEEDINTDNSPKERLSILGLKYSYSI